MASLIEDNSSNVTQEKDEFCKIEASVVTGFEECARGEAKEKFGVDVHTSRGRINFEIPLQRLNEVSTMGSIDNFRVVMHTVRHFHFTDQDDSLGRLQKMIVDVDWESGLKAWRKMFDFPHPIASRPDVIPTPDELVDVVVQTRLPQPKDKSGGKKKNQGRGKGKKKGKDKGDGGKKNEKVCNEESLEKEKLVEENLNAEIKTESKDEAESVSTEMNVGGGDGPSVVDNSEDKTVQAPSDMPSNTEKVSGETSAEVEKKQKVVASPKTVVIRKITEAELEQKIDIKMIDPNVFPTHMRCEELRQLEPMEIDSPNASFSTKVTSTCTDIKDENKSAGVVDANVNSSSIENTESPQPGLVEKAKEFASSVIKRLSTPPNSPPRNIPSGSASCSTPPPTPILSLENPFLSASEKPKDCASPDPLPVPVVAGVKSGNDDSGSSTDPPCFDKISDKLQTQPSLNEESAPKSTETESKDKATEEDPLATSQDKAAACDALETANQSTDKVSTIENLPRVASEEDSSTAVVGKPNGVVVDTPSPVKEVKEVDPTLPKFRVTCNRVGEHKFDSSSAAASFGSAVITYFGWPVDLKKFDIEILLNIDNEEVSVGLALTKTSLHNRNLVAFGPTTLRATICYNMLRLSRIRNGDFICDPMCGTSAIPVESALNWTNCYTFGGDFHEKAIERTVANMAAAQQKALQEKKSHIKLDAVQWNIEHFPLRDACVDVFISDLPFGHRLGSRTVNRTLYPCLLTEMARTARTGARACLLTEDRTSLIKAIQTVGKFWQRRLIQSVNIGGLNGFVFVLIRTPANFVREDLNKAPAPSLTTSENNAVQSPTKPAAADTIGSDSQVTDVATAHSDISSVPNDDVAVSTESPEAVSPGVGSVAIDTDVTAATFEPETACADSVVSSPSVRSVAIDTSVAAATVEPETLCADSEVPSPSVGTVAIDTDVTAATVIPETVCVDVSSTASISVAQADSPITLPKDEDSNAAELNYSTSSPSKTVSDGLGN